MDTPSSSKGWTIEPVDILRESEDIKKLFSM